MVAKCTGCGHKYKFGNGPALCAYCDPVKRAKRAQEQREQELADQIESDIAAGRRDGWSGRIKPRFED